MPDLFVIEDSTIDQLLLNTSLVEAVGCLRNYPIIAKKCGSCPRARTKRSPDYNHIKACMRGLVGEEKQKLKAHFNAKQLRVIYVSGGAKIKFTF